MAGSPAFTEHSLARTVYKDLHVIEQWAAQKWGWTEKTWDTDKHVPTNLATYAVYNLPPGNHPKTHRPWRQEMTLYMGHQGQRFFINDSTGLMFADAAQVPISAHFLATRVLKYTVSTCVLHSHSAHDA